MMSLVCDSGDGESGPARLRRVISSPTARSCFSELSNGQSLRLPGWPVLRRDLLRGVPIAEGWVGSAEGHSLMGGRRKAEVLLCRSPPLCLQRAEFQRSRLVDANGSESPLIRAISLCAGRGWPSSALILEDFLNAMARHFSRGCR